MNWIEDYRRKVTTAEEALSAVRSGDRIYVHEGCGTPTPLIHALLNRSRELRNVETLHMLTFGDASDKP